MDNREKGLSSFMRFLFLFENPSFANQVEHGVALLRCVVTNARPKWSKVSRLVHKEGLSMHRAGFERSTFASKREKRL